MTSVWLYNGKELSTMTREELIEALAESAEREHEYLEREASRARGTVELLKQMAAHRIAELQER